MNKREYFFVSSFLSVIFVAIIGLLLSSLVLTKGVDYSEEYNAKANSYYSIDYDFIVPSPVYNQIVDMRKLDSVDKVFYYYEMQSTLKFNNLSLDVDSEFSANKDTYLSDYNDRRIIRKLDTNPDNFIYIDEYTSQYLSVDLNDEVYLTLNGVLNRPFTVSAIFLNSNFSAKPKNFFFYGGETEKFIKETKVLPLNYKAALVKAEYKMYSQCFSDLSSFGPEALMKKKSEFSSDAAYEEYVSNFRSLDYSDSIIKTKVSLENINETYGNLLKSSKLRYIICLIIIPFSFIALLLNIFLIRKFSKKRVYYNGCEPILSNEIIKKYSSLGVFALVVEAFSIYVVFFDYTKGKKLLFDYRGSVTVYIALGLIIGFILYLTLLSKVTNSLEKKDIINNKAK